MVFHPVVQEVARALQARRQPPPPVVPALDKEVLRRFGNVVLRHPSRRSIAEQVLVLAMRLDVLGFYRPRDQLLLLAGCGLSAAEITDSLERRRAGEAGAHQLMQKARSTSATPLERLRAEGSDGTSTGVGLRSRQRALQRARQERQARADRVTQERQARAERPAKTAQPHADRPTQVSRRGRPKPSGPSGPAGSGRPG